MNVRNQFPKGYSIVNKMLENEFVFKYLSWLITIFRPNNSKTTPVVSKPLISARSTSANQQIAFLIKGGK